MKLTKSITVKTFALMAAAVLTVSSPLAVFAADQTSMNDQATEAAQKFYRAALEAGNDEETAMKIAQDAVIKTKKAIVQKKAEDISDGTVSDELTDEEKQILDEVMKEDTAQSAAAASTESSEPSAASTQSGADLQAQAENQNDAALYLSQAAAQAKDIQDAARKQLPQSVRKQLQQPAPRQPPQRLRKQPLRRHKLSSRRRPRLIRRHRRCRHCSRFSCSRRRPLHRQHRSRQPHRRIQQCPLLTASCSPRSFTAKQATRAIPERSRLAMSL